MKKSLLMVAIVALAFASCSKDEVVEVQQDAVTFNVVADNASRANVYANNNLPGEFMTYGYAGVSGEVKTIPYANGEKVVRKDTNGNKYVFDNNVWFWPIEANLDFFCYAPVAGVTYEAKTIKDFSVNTDITKQVDLIYAVAKDQNKAADKATGVDLNFRHALSQVVFQVKSLASVGLDVKVNSIKIANIEQAGTFAFAESSTENAVTSVDDIEAAGEGWGTWTLAGTKADFSTGTLATALEVAPNDQAVAASEALLLMPQTLAPATAGTWTDGAYFLIDCAITKNGVTLWPASSETDGFGEVAIPAGAITWKQGVKYTYTFVFGKGGGYEPGTDNPVLVPIDFNVNIDVFADTDGGSIDMEAK